MGDNAQRIAIVGMAGKFPGADDTEAFWANLVAGRESIDRFTADQLRAHEPDVDTLLKNPNFIAARGVLADIDLFDAGFFGLSPREAAVLDPQQRLWLEAAWIALEQAGVDPQRFAGPIGVFAGATCAPLYLMYHLLSDRQSIENQVKHRAPENFLAMISNDSDFLPSRTAYKLDLRGPAVNVQTACSTALVALHMACQSLLSFESDIALAGGVSIALPQVQGYMAQEGGMRSLDGHCRSFDEHASGTVFSSGLGAFVLKRYEDAIDDGNEILAVVRGSALNNDGADKVSYGAPSAIGQANVIAMAQAIADVHPDQIRYVEAHGTATPLGDPIEVDGLTQAWRRKSTATGRVLLGSVKSNVGHLDAAAGAAGLVKTIYALREGRIPATLHFTTPNPRIDFEHSPFRVVAELTDWPDDDLRLAGVSSFGVGGTNAHVVLEQAPDAEPSPTPIRAAQLLVLSAKTPGALARRCSDLADWLTAHDDVALADVAWTLATGRAEMGFRQYVVASSIESAIAALRSRADSGASRQATEADQPPVAFLFPGQGAQHPGMGQALYAQAGVFRDTVDRLAGYLASILNVDIRDLLYPQPGSDQAAAHRRLQDTGMAQPALFVVQMALARLWAAWGIRPAAMLGHSVGEYVAACLAGALDEHEACRVLAARARLMADMPGGSMLAVRRSESQVQSLLSDEIALAAVNSPGICVISGPTAAIDGLAERLAAAGEETIPLHTSHAFHSPMMDDAVTAYRAVLEDAAFSAPEQPIMSCITGQWLNGEQACAPDYWARQLRETVRFSSAFQALQADPALVYLECGPSQNLTAAARQHASATARPLCIPSQAHASADQPADHALLAALGELWQAGVSPDWPAVCGHEDAPRRLLHLPTYAFDRQRYWIDAPELKPDSKSSPQTAAEPDSAIAAQAISNPVAGMPEPHAAPPAAMPCQPTSGPARMTRKAYLTSILADLLLELSGIEIGETAHDRPFTALGMDSLFLTQVATEISSRFDINLRFRQLLEGIDTLDRLAAHLDDSLPADRFQPPAPPAPTPVTTEPVPTASAAQPAAALPVAIAQTTSIRTAADSSAHGLIQQQLDIMRQQLALLGSHAGTARPVADSAGSSIPAPVAVSSGELAPSSLSSGGASVHAHVAEASQGLNLAASAPGRFGPYKTINHDRDGRLTDTQQQFLDALIATLTARTAASKQLGATARRHLADPRGVANFRRAWKELVYQIVAQRTDGATMTDIDGNEYVDITMGFGVGFMGHRHPAVVRAVQEQLDLGFEVGPQTPLAPVVAEKFCRLLGHERVTFCNTGSEAVMAALRCARTVTGRRLVVYFSGDYHGTFDEVLGRANIVKGELSTRPVAPGLVQDSVDNVMVLDYGTDASLEILRQRASDIAAVLVEPVQSRYPDLQPVEFIHALREITRASGSALIVDEVITGFRCALGGIKSLWQIEADMFTYGKILGGGLPIGALAGNSKWLDAIDGGAWSYGDDSVPEAPVTFFAGTFVRHPLVMAAANAVLDFLAADDGALQNDLNARTSAFARELNAFFVERGAPLRIRHFSSLFRFDLPQDQPFAGLMFYWMLAHGIYIREGAQNNFFSIAHSDADIRRVIDGVKQAVIAVQAAGFMPGAGTTDASPQVASSDATTTGKSVAAGDAGLAVGESMPLTEGQREIWLAQIVRPDAAHAFNELIYLEFPGLLDARLFAQALEQTVVRHESLALRFAADGESQTRVAALPMPIKHVDVSDGEDPHARALELIHAMRSIDFDLEAADQPLFRVHIFKLGADRSIAAMVFHHLVCDGWSGAVLFDELSALYTALAGDTQPQLRPAVPFSRYARSLAARENDIESQLGYWRSLYATPPAALALPTRAPRSAHDDAPADGRLQRIAPALQGAVSQRATAENVTPYAIYLAAYAALLCRLADQQEIVVAMPVAGQALEGLNSLVGHCVQLLPLRIGCAPDEAFRDVLLRVRAAINKACTNADCTYGQIVRALDLKRDPLRLPLAEVVFNFSPSPLAPKFADLTGQLHEPLKHSVHFDLHFNLTQDAQGLLLHCDFNRHLFDAATVERWIADYERLLARVADDPAVRIADLPVASAVPASADPTVGKGASLPVIDESLDLAGLFRRQAQSTPDALAIAHAQGRWSYRDLDRYSDAIAAALHEQGVESGERVGLCLPRAPRLLAAMLGILKAGAAYVPMDPDYPAERLRYIASDSGIRRVLSWLDGPQLAATCIDIDKAMECRAPVPAAAGDASRLAYIIYTSGSTGQPKGVCVRQRNVLALLAWARTMFSDNEVSGMLAAASVCFDFSIFEIFVPLTRGGSVVLVDNLLSLMQAPPAPVSLVSGVPSAMTELLQHTTLPAGVTTVCMGGEALKPALVAQLHQQAGVRRVLDGYGPTETTVFATMAERSVDGPQTIGRPIEGWRVYILDEQGVQLGTGARGELVIGGLGVTAGYIGRDELTAARYVADPFMGGDARMYRTGDLACWLADGQIEYAGRMDHQVKIRGFRIELGEIESALQGHAAVARCVVAPQEARPGDVQLVAYWQAEAGQAPATPADLRRFIRERLPLHMVPQQFVTMYEWPMLANGKLNRAGLANPFATSVSAAVTPASAAASVESSQALARIWAQVLDCDVSAQLHETFLDLGGHSLLAVRATAAARRELGVDIPVRAMMLDSLGQLALRVDGETAAADTASDAKLSSSPGPESTDAGTDTALSSHRPPPARGLAERLGLRRKS